MNDVITLTGDDQQVTIACSFQNMAAFVHQIGAYAAADVGPALGQVAVKLAGRFATEIRMKVVHEAQEPPDAVQSAINNGSQSVGKFYAPASSLLPIK
jgi:hypothetical protein